MAEPELPKPSRIWLAAWVAAEKALPDEARELIEQHDKLYAAWREAGWPTPAPAELQAAAKAVESDPFASIAFECRTKTNTQAHKEWREEKPISIPTAGPASAQLPTSTSLAASAPSAVADGQQDQPAPPSADETEL